MRARVLLLAALGFAAQPATAQAPEVEAYSHILSAFTSRADPRVLSESVTLGPSLRRELGGETSFVKIYDALVERQGGSRVELRSLRPGEADQYAAVPGVNTADPLFTLRAGESTLLLQYAPAQKRVAFVEELRTPTAKSSPPEPRQAEAPKTAPVAVTAPPVAAPAVSKAAPAVAAPAVAAVPVVAKPAATKPAPQPKPAAARPAPNGPCVVKPVMSEQDLANCAVATPSAPVAAAVERPAPPPPAAPALQAPAPEPQCVIKPVMSEEDLRICARASAAPRPAVAERAAPAPAAPAASAQKPEAPAARPCVVKPVMSDDELRACGVRR